MSDKKPPSTACARRGRPPGSKNKKKGQISNVTINQKFVPATRDSASVTQAVVCSIAFGFKECLMRICYFFASIHPATPKEVNLLKVVSESQRILQKISFPFENFEWSIQLAGNTLGGYSISEADGISKQWDSFILEMFVEQEIICDNLNYWFSMEQHKFTILKCESQVIGIIKFDEKFYVYDPNNTRLTVEDKPTCQLTECYNTVQLEQVIRDSMEGHNLSDCTVMTYLIAMNVTRADLATTTHIVRRSNEEKRKNEVTDMQECGRSGKKAKKCQDASASDCNMILEAACTVTTNKNVLFMHICSLFSLIDVNKPNQINLDAVVRLSDAFMNTYPNSSIEQFDMFNFVYNTKSILIYKIFGYSTLNDELYETYKFVMACDKVILLNNLKRWFVMGYHEKTVFQCFSKVFGILKSGKLLHTEGRYYIFDPNECFSDGKDDISSTPNVTFTECGDIEELADVLYNSLNSKSLVRKSFECTMFAVNTLAPIEGSDVYITTEPPSYERSQKVKGRMKIATLISKENEDRLEEQRKKLREYSARRWADMSEAEREEELRRLREYSARRLADMSEAEREDELRRLRDKSARRWADMSEAEREEELRRLREYKARKWADMSEAEREEQLGRLKEYSARRWADMSEAEREEELRRLRENSGRRLADMSEAEREKELRRLREKSARIWADMGEEEKIETRKKQRDYEAGRVGAMTTEERAEYRKKHREYEAEKRKSMTAEEKAAAKLKAKERYKKDDKEVAEKLQLTTSIKKQFKFKGKKGLLKDNIVGALGGKPENHLEGEIFVNATLQRRTDLLHQQAKALVSIFYTFKHRKAKCDAQENIEDKYVTMLGTSLHTKHSEAYFPDTTYKSMPANTYALDDNGLLDLKRNEGDDSTASTWYCNERCDIDVAVIYARLYTIFEVVLKSTEIELISFIDNIDNCDNRALADVAKLGHPKQCYIHNGNNYGCSSVLLFLRSASPHYPFMRNIVSTVYKVRKELRMLRELDVAIDNTDMDVLRRITDEWNGKSAENSVQTRDWPYANEFSISAAHSSAFVALQRKCADLPTIVCISCMELCFKRDVRQIGDFYPHRSICNRWDDLLDVHEGHNYQYGKFICLYCYDKFNRGKTLPPTCLLNNLQVRETPLCITRLNDYEQMLIQRAKAFQVVTRMGAVAKKNRPRQEMIQKVIGRTFHLPLPIEQTLRKMPTPQQAIAANQDLYILVRGMPSTQKRIFQSYVNVNHVYEALQWLQRNNPLYNQIILPSLPDNILDGLDNEEDVQFNLDDIRSQTEDSATAPPEIAAMLTPKDIGDKFYEHVTFHSIGTERPNEQPSTVYQFKKVFDKPIDNREKDLDVRCFPHLFCYAENGQFAERDYDLPLRQFMKNRMKSVYSQFRLNIQYIFFLLNIINMRQIAASIYTAINVTPQIKNMTAKLLREKLAKNDFDKNASTIFTSLRNSKAFWNKPKNDINCMVKYYGAATWFLTISPSEYNWNDLEKYLREVNGPRAVGKTASALIAMDPISTSRFIENKFKAMLAFICSKDNPIGEVAHYAWRREYQSRGLQHFHLMIWIKGAPILGESTNEEVENFISKYATCRLPDQTLFPTLYSRVMSYQQHHHNTYCLRGKKTKQGGFISRCRFDFPRPVTTSITLRDVATSIHGRRKLKLKSRLYDLRRTAAEVNINDYNPAIMLAWEGNMDIQFIGEKTAALCHYICKYIGKAEKSLMGDGFCDIAATKPLYSKLWLMGQRILSNRECGALEAADTLLQNSLFGTDSDTTIKWLDVRKERNRKLRDYKQLETLAEDDTDVYTPSLIDVHYPNRPAGLENECIYDFASKYDIVKAKPQRSDEFYAYGKLFVKRRKNACLINHYNFNMEKDSEKYFYTLLLLYKPFRNESELLGSFKTFAESFDYHKEELTEALRYHEKMQDIEKARKELDEKVRLIEEASQAEAADANVCGSQNALCIDNPEDIRPFIAIDNISDNDLSQMVESLNADQLRVFNYITTVLLQQQSGDPNARVLRYYLSGIGGTGKSYLIKVLRQWVRNELGGEVVVCAPTGIAALNVKGLTIHSFLRLPVEHGNTPEYKQLTDVTLQQLRNELKDVKLIIIDEISMVSNLVLLFIHLRLQEIYNTFQVEDGWFGRINILFFGDLLQLSPVRANAPFVTLSAAELSKVLTSVPADINLWSDLFSYDELTINVRQQSDQSYGNILSRIRLGIIDDNDQEELEGRLLHFTPNKNQEDYLKQVVAQVRALPSTCVCLFPRKGQCAELNLAMLSLLSGPEIILPAQDKVEGRTNILRQKAVEYLKKLGDDSSHTGALEETLTVKIGCKVMLRKNISPTLVNGSIGTLKEIIKGGIDDSVSKIKIQFNDEEHLLERLEVKFEVYKNVYVVRSQFPITLAYGITIHKSQSLSLECCLMDVGNYIFCEGQTYVALSRLTTLNGLYLVNYDPTKVMVDHRAVHEYNRLRRLYRPDLEEIAITVNDSSFRKDILWWKRGYIEADPVGRRDAEPANIPVFRRDSNNCFANSALQCLFSIASINNNIMLAQDSPLKRLAVQYNDPFTAVLNSDEIIQHLNFTLGEMQDTTEFITVLAESFPHIKKAFQFVTQDIKDCTSCSNSYRVVFAENDRQHHLDLIYKMSLPTTAETSLLLRHSKSKTKTLTMNDFLRHACAPKPLEGSPCPVCKVANVTTSSISIREAANVVIIAFNIFQYTTHGVDRLPLKLSSVPASILDIAGSRYKLKAAIFHYGKNEIDGHYTAYIRVENKWKLLNDMAISDAGWPKLSQHLYMLFYEKVTR